MESIIIYLLKASGLTLLFFMAYHVFLRKETFFTGNRWFLLAGLFTSAILPLIIFTTTTWVAPAPAIMPVNLPDVIIGKNSTSMSKPETFNLSWQQVVMALYCAGLVFFMTRLIYDIIKIHTIIKQDKVVNEKGFKIIDSENIPVPFSFFRYIAYNSKGLQPHELQSIINHEKVHSREWHSLDMIIAQLFCIMLWFNPFIWLYKKAIVQNLEFIADEAATAYLDKTQYQKTLLKITVQPECTSVTNNFYQSLIKKRIIMLNKQPSKKVSAVKYAFIVPALCAFIYFFQVQVVAQNKPDTHKPLKFETAYIEINKDLTDEALKQNESAFKTGFNASVVFSNITRNKNGEITRINVKVTDGKNNKEFETENQSPIEPFYISIENKKDGGNNIAIGKYKTIISAREIQMSYNGPDGNTNDKLDIYGQMSYISDEHGSGLRLSDNGNSGFVVNKQTTDRAFEHYKEKLKDINIELRYSEIKRDKRGYIQSIRMDVVDLNNEHPFKISLLNYAKGNTGINDIYIGRRDGRIIAGEPGN